jgi:hypothetical protein
VKPRTDHAFPSPSDYRSWLHDVGGSPAALAVVKGLSNKPIDYIQERKPQREITLEMDATFIPTKQGDAPVNYRRSFQKMPGRDSTTQLSGRR